MGEARTKANGNDKVLDLKPSGKIEILMDDGTRIGLRRPNFDELIALREVLEDLNDSIFEKTIDSKVTKEAIKQLDNQDITEMDEKEISRRIKLQLEGRKLERQLRDELEAGRIDWVKEVVSTLKESPKEDVDLSKAPSWWANHEAVDEIRKHLESVPLVRGAS